MSNVSSLWEHGPHPTYETDCRPRSRMMPTIASREGLMGISALWVSPYLRDLPCAGTAERTAWRYGFACVNSCRFSTATSV